jgi:hypothetical protein
VYVSSRFEAITNFKEGVMRVLLPPPPVKEFFEAYMNKMHMISAAVYVLRLEFILYICSFAGQKYG